jgi:hypothetical protein
MSASDKDPAAMTDHELVVEWEAIDVDRGTTARGEALIAEMEKRQLDF